LDKKFCDVNSARFVNSSTVQHDHEQLITYYCYHLMVK